MVSPLVECPADCGWRWTQTWFGDCACGVRDRLSFALGLASILAWGSAELPQIYANFRNGRSEGISLAFIVTWLTGDALNLLGCAVSPTLPTQLYTALVYTATTVVLIAQHVHYNSVPYNARRRHRRLKNILDDDRDDLEALLPTGPHGSGGEALTGSSWSDEDDDATTTRTRRASFTPSVASVASEAAASVQGGRAIGRGRDGDVDGAGGASSTGARTAPSSARTFLAGSWQASSSSTRAFSPPARRDARASHGGRWSGGGGEDGSAAVRSRKIVAAARGFRRRSPPPARFRSWASSAVPIPISPPSPPRLVAVFSPAVRPRGIGTRRSFPRLRGWALRSGGP